MAASPQQISQLLIAWSNGDKAALDQLMPLVYSELRRLASNYLRRERQEVARMGEYLEAHRPFRKDLAENPDPEDCS